MDMELVPSDGELVDRTLGGERRAFDELVRRYQRQAVAVAYRLVGNAQDAQDVTQDAFLRAFDGLASLQKQEAFGGWFLRIVSNLSLNYRRSRKTRNTLPLEGLEDTDQADTSGQVSGRPGAAIDPARQTQSGEMGRRLKEALEQLPEKQRLAIAMFAIEEMPQKQVAEALQCSVEAVKWHVFQGRKRLKELMKDYM